MINKCDKPVCCTMFEGKSTDPATAAGPFGDYHCDLPEWTFDEIIRLMSFWHAY